MQRSFKFRTKGCGSTTPGSGCVLLGMAIFLIPFEGEFVIAHFHVHGGTVGDESVSVHMMRRSAQGGRRRTPLTLRIADRRVEEVCDCRGDVSVVCVCGIDGGGK